MQNINYIPPSDPMFSALGPVETWDDDARTFYAQSQPNAEAKAKAQDIVTIDTDSALPVDEQIHQNLIKLWREEHLTLIPIPSARLGGSAQVAGNLEDHTSQLRGSSATARAPEPMSPDVDLSLKAAFSRVKQFQLDLYLAQIQNIDAMLSPSDPQASYDNLTVHLLSAFLRDVCLDTGLVDLPHLTAAIQEFGNCQENTAKALAQGIKTDFWEMLGELNVSSEDIEQMRRDYHSEHVYRESQEHDALWIDTVTKEFIGRLYYIDQEAFTTSMNAASDVHGVERIRDVFEAQRTCLKSLASLVRQQNNPAQIAELIYCYEDQGTWEYVFDEVIGMDAGIMYQISQTPDKRPPGATHEEWVLARQIQRYHENPDLGDASLGQQIWSVIKYYPPLMLVDWTVADTEQGPLAHAWGSIRDDFDRLRADGSQHLVQEIHDTKIEEKPLEPETVYEPAQPTATPGVMTTASAEFKSLFPLGNPVTDPLEQLSIVRDTMAPGFEASKLLLHNMALTGTFGKGAQIPNFVVHLFKLALITYSEFDATPDATSERTRMQKALERFMMLLFGYDDDNTNLAQYFVNAFSSMSIAGQSMPEWARSHHQEIHNVFGYEVDSIPDLMTIPEGFETWFSENVATQEGVFGQLQEMAHAGETITSFNQTFEPVAYIRNQLENLEGKTEKTIGEMNKMDSPDSIYEFLNKFCPKKEGRDYLLSLLGINLDATNLPNKPEDMSQAQWQHSLSFAAEYERYTGTQGQAQMIGMSVMMCACMAAAFANPILGMVAMLPMGGMSVVDIGHEQAKLRRYHSGAVSSHQEGNVESSDIDHVVNAQLDLWDSQTMLFVNIGAIALGVNVGMASEKISRCGLRIAAEAGFGFADGIVATGADGRVARSGAPEQALFMGVAFGMAAGAVGGGMAKRAGAFQAGDTIPAFKRTFDAQAGWLDDGSGNLGVVAEIDGEPVSFALDKDFQAGGREDGSYVISDDGKRRVLMEIVDPNTGEARVTVEQKMDHVVSADEATSVARFWDAEAVIPDARVDAAVRESARPNLDRLLASDVFQGHLEQQRLHNPDGEFEVYQRFSGDPPVIEYLYVHGEEGRGDMGSYLVSTDAEGNPIEMKPTQEGISGLRQEGWGLLAHAHPSTDGISVMPTPDDLVAMMDYGAPEHFILRTDPETGDLHQARVFVQDGQRQIEFGELFLRHVHERDGYVKSFEAAREEIVTNLTQEFDGIARQAIEEFKQKPADEVRAVASDPSASQSLEIDAAAVTIQDIAIPMGADAPPRFTSEVLIQNGFDSGTQVYNVAMEYIQTCLRSGEITQEEIPDVIVRMQGADRFQYMINRYGGTEGFLREAEVRSELRVQIRESEMNRLTGAGAVQQAARNARIVVPSVLSIPGEARVVSVADVELVGSYYTRMQTQNPGDDAIRIVGENYRSLIVADTSVAGHSADYAGRGVDQGFFGNDVPGVRTLDHHGDFALGAEGQTDARNSTMKMLDVMEEALARHDGNIERAVQELNIGAATTDNLGDGGWCVWMARNQRQVLADGNLRNMIREATFFEDVSAFGTTYLGQEGSPALQLQAAIFFEYNRILDEHGIVGTDRFSDAQAASILEQACAAIDHMVADETARAQAADAFFRDVEGTAHLASEEAVISNASVDGQVVFFDTSKLGGASTFTRFLAIPRAHALSMHVNCVPLPGNKYLYFVGIPHDRSLPSGKSLVDVVDRVRAAEAAKAVALGIEAQDIWVAKAEVMFVAKGKTSLLTPDELSAILTDPDLGLFGSKAVTELPTPDKVTGPLATVTGRDGVYRLLDAQDPDNVTVIGPIDQNANQMFRVRLSDVTPLQRKTIDETQAQDMPVAFSHHLLTMRERSRRYTLEMGSQGKDFGLDLSHESVAGVHAMLRFDKAKDSYAIAPRRGQAVWIKRGNDTFCLPGDSKSIKEFYLQDGDLIQFGDAIPIRFEKPTHTMHAYPQVSQSTVNELAALPPVVIAEPVNIDGALITRDHRGFYYVTEPGAEGVTLLDHGTLIKTDNGYVTFKRPEFAAGDGAMFKGGDLREQWVVVKSEGDQITIWREGSDERIVSASELSKMTDDDQHSFAGSDYSRYQKARPAQAQPAVPAAPSIAKNDIVSIEGQEGTYQVVDFKGDDAFVIGPQESAEPNLLKFPKSQMLLADVQQANIDVASMPEAFSRKMVSLQKNALRPGVLPIVLMRKGSAEQYGLDFTHPSNENLNVIFSYKQEGDFYELTAMGEGQVIITRDGDSVPVPISNGEHQVILKDGDIIQFGETAPFRWQEPERIDLDAPSHENPIAMDLDARQSRVPVVDVAQPIVPVTRARAEADVLHLKRLFRSKTTLHFGPSKSLERKVLTIMPDAEIFVAASKLKHHGRIEVMQDPKGTRVIKFIDAITGAEEFFLPEEIIAVRERGDEGYAQSMDLCRVDNPHLADKSINASGRLGNRMQVLVDYTDPRLQRFFKKSGLEKLRTVLDEGNLNKQDAAQAAWQIIKTKVKYDYSRLEEDGSPDNRMYNLSEFLDEGVCNERGMLLQVALQYLGIESQLEKGTVVRKYDADPLQGQRVFGRHAWVRVTDPDILKPREILILDPQVDDPLYSYYLPNGRIYVLDTQTLFVRDRAETFVIGASAREAFVNGAAMLEGADGVGARSATDTGIISADEMARSTLDPDARMDTGEIVVDVSTVPQRGHPARHQEPIGRVELKGSEFDSSNFAQQLARFTDDVESRETIPLEIHVDDITLINRTEFDNTIKTTFQETGATWSVVAIHDQKTNQVVYHYVNIDPSVGSPKVLEIPVRSSVERGHQIAKQYMTIDDYSKIEETISHWPIENQNLFWQEIESLVCQVVEPRIILPFGGKNKPFKISTDHPNVSAQINGLLATIDPYFQPLESMKPFRRVVGTHEQAVDYHVTNPKPSDYLTQEGLSNTFIDNTGQPQEYFVPHYVQEKIDGWMNLVTHDLNTETKGKLVVETRDDGSLMIVDFIPHATISESIVLSAIQDYGEGQMHSLALPAGRVSRILGYDSEVANPVSVEGLTTIDMHTHFYGDQMQSAYQDSPSPPDFRSKGVKKIEAVCTPKSGLIFYVRATEDDPDFGKHTTIYSRDMTSEQQGGNT